MLSPDKSKKKKICVLRIQNKFTTNRFVFKFRYNNLVFTAIFRTDVFMQISHHVQLVLTIALQSVYIVLYSNNNVFGFVLSVEQIHNSIHSANIVEK